MVVDRGNFHLLDPEEAYMAIDNSKIYYSIGEVCEMLGLEPHVLRYWENEFPQLRPKKNRAGNRAYRLKDIRIIDYIKHLLYEEKYTIEGARKKLAQSKEYSEPPGEPENISSGSRQGKDVLSAEELRDELREVLKIIGK